MSVTKVNPVAKAFDIRSRKPASNTLTYTGVSFEVPAMCACNYTARTVYSNARPLKITVATSSTALTTGSEYTCGRNSQSDNNVLSVSGTYVNTTANTVTLYVWVQCGSSNSSGNDVIVAGVNIPIQLG